MSSLRAEGARLACFVTVVEANLNKLIPFGFPCKSPIYLRALSHLPVVY